LSRRSQITFGGTRLHRLCRGAWDECGRPVQSPWGEVKNSAFEKIV